ncbi:MAG TPA: hypothetical protein VGV15_21975, partial [Terriglobales bacterium]|nr:hypothetical protein [Terriglobales bacterium]
YMGSIEIPPVLKTFCRWYSLILCPAILKCFHAPIPAHALLRRAAPFDDPDWTFVHLRQSRPCDVVWQECAARWFISFLPF